MGIQLLLVGLFALNLLLVWLLVFSRKFEAYKYLAMIIFPGVILISVFFDQPRFELDYFWWKVAGLVFILIGAGIFTWAQLEFKKLKAQLLGTPSLIATGGPFEFVRHPHYLAAIFMMVGWWWVWAAVYSFYFGMFILAILWIEAYLEEKLIMGKNFGDQYRQYQKDTGMFWIK